MCSKSTSSTKKPSAPTRAHRHSETLPGCMAFTKRGARKMKNLDFSRYALCSCVALAAMLAACGGSQPPVGAPGAMPQTSAIATHVDRGTSWMLPGLSGRGLLYVVMRVGAVDILSYPACKKL